MAEKEYIEREAAKIAVCRSNCRTYCQRGVCEHTEVIRKIPAADVRPVVRGKWIAEQFVDEGGPLHKILSKYDTLVCSICGYKYLDLCGRKYNYCPGCGADMRD